ncbi:MAG: hypothetical protein H8E44_29000 [Planctomycetes bacterium]|nr:hypothetical protein [Planctomycetota bacterium]MBL7040791.1 hypothetical protein [Pirellulaceae bacterium]
MIDASRFMLLCFLVVLSSCLPMQLHATEPKTPVIKRLNEIIEWTAADEDTATERLIDCLSDEREIAGATLRGRAKEAWKFLRSRTNVEISVHEFALHQLCQIPERSKALLTKRIHSLDDASEVDRARDWSPTDGHPVYRLLKALTEVHQNQLHHRGIIPETQVIIELKREAKAGALGVSAWVYSSLTIIAGYVDHRDKKFSDFVSGKTDRGRNQITVTRSNIVSLADAIRDSNIKDSKP